MPITQVSDVVYKLLFRTRVRRYESIDSGQKGGRFNIFAPLGTIETIISTSSPNISFNIYKQYSTVYRPTVVMCVLYQPLLVGYLASLSSFSLANFRNVAPILRVYFGTHDVVTFGNVTSIIVNYTRIRNRTHCDM